MNYYIFCLLKNTLRCLVNKIGYLLTEHFDFASDIIATSVEAVGGRYMMIECRDEEKLIQFYKDNYFSEVARIPDENQPMVQMIRKID